MIAVRTMVDPQEGIIGLNGEFYLLEEDGSLMEFESEEDAREFVSMNGEDPDNEFIDYVDSSIPRSA